MNKQELRAAMDAALLVDKTSGTVLLWSYLTDKMRLSISVVRCWRACEDEIQLYRLDLCAAMPRVECARPHSRPEYDARNWQDVVDARRARQIGLDVVVPELVFPDSPPRMTEEAFKKLCRWLEESGRWCQEVNHGPRAVADDHQGYPIMSPDDEIGPGFNYSLELIRTFGLTVERDTFRAASLDGASIFAGTAWSTGYYGEGEALRRLPDGEVKETWQAALQLDKELLEGARALRDQLNAQRAEAERARLIKKFNL